MYRWGRAGAAESEVFSYLVLFSERESRAEQRRSCLEYEFLVSQAGPREGFVATHFRSVVDDTYLPWKGEFWLKLMLRTFSPHTSLDARLWKLTTY